jgi:hypothetical protein
MGIVKGGLLVAARATGAVVVPLTGSMHRGLVLRRSWDRFAVAWPFTRVEVVLGEPIDPREHGDAREAVEQSLAALNIPREPASGLSEPGSVRRLA